MSCQVFNIGVALQVAATEQNMMIVGRAIAGFGVGLVSAIGRLDSFQYPSRMANILCFVVPLYQSETAPKWIRGTIVGAYQWAITFGIFLGTSFSPSQ